MCPTIAVRLAICIIPQPNSVHVPWIWAGTQKLRIKPMGGDGFQQPRGSPFTNAPGCVIHSESGNLHERISRAARRAHAEVGALPLCKAMHPAPLLALSSTPAPTVCTSVYIGWGSMTRASARQWVPLSGAGCRTVVRSHFPSRCCWQKQQCVPGTVHAEAARWGYKCSLTCI